jgi:hypothetical protein
MSSNREALLAGHGGATAAAGDAATRYGATGGGGGDDVRLTVEEHRADMRVEDGALGTLADGVGQVKNVANALHNEVVGQVRLLDGLVEGVQTADRDTQRAARRAGTIERNPYTIYNFCLLLWPCVLVVILVFAMLRHWLFS